MNVIDLMNDEPPKPRKKTELEKLREDMQRQLAPIRQIQEAQDLVRRYSSECQARELLKQFEPERQLREMLKRTAIPKQVQEMLDGTYIAVQSQQMLEQYFPKNPQAQHAEALRWAAVLDSVSEEAINETPDAEVAYQFPWGGISGGVTWAVGVGRSWRGSESNTRPSSSAR